jgi:hypothetical protein
VVWLFLFVVLPVSLDCSFLIVPSVFSNAYLIPIRVKPKTIKLICFAFLLSTLWYSYKCTHLALNNSHSPILYGDRKCQSLKKRRDCLFNLLHTTRYPGVLEGVRSQTDYLMRTKSIHFTHIYAHFLGLSLQ